ncbi:peptide ABC transporter substrate-binding protein [Desulfosporosinus fructosivorans]|uniref:Peptide ABC transporter substrate-binding protein n=1 Tax=Desulfosporosinus fructosivorans TaxID=2018669 RepID=A0A4Z0R7A1_9FIRM|nr:ABC transporter substrate-binding protein [Desulfosporosinus fructosivorans]TGE38690.1 peptide ABC transporter substrate-binding protein [Desulfosporosinus fructosivorans]
MFKKIKAPLAAAVVGLLLVVTGCGTAASTTPTTSSNVAVPKDGGTLNIALSSDAPKLDPALSSSVYDRYVFQSLFDKLVDIDKDGKIVPMLAEKIDVSTDGLVYTFHLHKGVKFTDGTDFNAEAVKFNFDRNMDKSSPRKGELGEVKAVSVVDPDTVKVELKQPFSPFLSILSDRAGMMVSPTAVTKAGQDFLNNPVGTGPFIFKERVKGNSITLVKNPNYWQKGLPHLDSVVYKIITDANVAAMNLKSGQVDMTDWRFPTKEIQNFKSDPNFMLINQAGQGYVGFYLNVSQPPFDNKYLRQAVDVLIDREALVKLIKNGAATAGHSPFAPGNLANGDSDKTFSPDTAKAKDFLVKAGKPDGFTFTYKTSTTPDNQRTAEMLQNMLKPAGITMNIEKLEFGTLLDQSIKGNFEASAVSWSGRPDPDQNIYDDVITNGSMNYGRYSNPQIDGLMKDARIEQDPAKRKVIYDQAMTILNEELPYIFFYHENNVFGLSKHIQGFVPISDGLIRTVSIFKN